MKKTMKKFVAIILLIATIFSIAIAEKEVGDDVYEDVGNDIYHVTSSAHHERHMQTHSPRIENGQAVCDYCGHVFPEGFDFEAHGLRNPYTGEKKELTNKEAIQKAKENNVTYSKYEDVTDEEENYQLFLKGKQTYRTYRHTFITEAGAKVFFQKIPCDETHTMIHGIIEAKAKEYHNAKLQEFQSAYEYAMSQIH